MNPSSHASDGKGIAYGSPGGRWVLAATVLGSGVAFLDASAVNVALPSIGEDLSAPFSLLQWVVDGYLLTLSALILIGGSLGDRFGRRRLFAFGMLWFGLSSLVCGLAPSGPVLVAARILQGVAGALVTPTSLAIIQASFRPRDRARAVGAWSGLTGIATVIGPVLGGFLTRVVSWRAVFFINLPLVVVTALIAWNRVPEKQGRVEGEAIDLPGTLLAVAGLGGLCYGLIEAPLRGLASPAVGLSLAVGILALLSLVAVERRSSSPLLPPEMFRSPRFSGTNIVTFVVYAALGGTSFLLAVQLQQVLGYSPLEAGAAMLPVTFMLLFLSPLAGRLAERIGSRPLMTAGPLLMSVGMLVLSRVGAGDTYLSHLLGPILIFGLGLGLTVAPLTATVLGAGGEGREGVASAINNAVARVANLVAVAALPLAGGLAGDVYLHPERFSQGFQAALVWAAGLALAGGMLAWLTVGPGPPSRGADSP